MPRIYTESTDISLQEKSYSAFLTGSLPDEGCLIVSGPHVFFLAHRPDLPSGQDLPVALGPVQKLHSAISSQLLSFNTYKSYLAGRHLPAGCALEADKDGITIFPSDAYEPDLGKMSIFQLSFDPLEEVLTPQEAASAYGINTKRVQWDAEHGSDGSLFLPGEVRKSGNTWLLLKSAAERVYGENPVPATPIHPFLLVFSTVEAAYLWNRDTNAVRSAAGGAGHASARMQAGDRRKSGRTWLVRREAMDRLFGQAVPERMAALTDEIRKG